jgi:hypothetical protein
MGETLTIESSAAIVNKQIIFYHIMNLQITDLSIYPSEDKDFIIDEVKSKLWEVNLDYDFVRMLDFLKNTIPFYRSDALTFHKDIENKVREKLVALIEKEKGISVFKLSYEYVVSNEYEEE